MANCRLATPTLSHAHFLARLETRASELSAAEGGQNSDRHASDILLSTPHSHQNSSLLGSSNVASLANPVQAALHTAVA